MKIKRFAMLLLMIVFVIQPTTAVFAERNYDYTVISHNRYAIPKTYLVDMVINNVGSVGGESGFLSRPADIFVKDEFIYIVDTGNNRIVKATLEGKALEFFGGPEGYKLSSPNGIFVDDSHDMYIADTGNFRILHLKDDGSFVEAFYKPDSELIDKKADFGVSKLVVSDVGYIYVVSGETIMTIDSNNVFRGYIGQTTIGFNLLETLQRAFASERQKTFMKKRLAESYINIDLGTDGMIYASSFERVEGEIKKLNSVGKNIYRKYKTLGDEYNPIDKFIKDLLKNFVITKAFKFGEYFDDDFNPMLPIFSDICVDKDGIVTVCEEQTGKIYQYDQAGNLLTVFGGLGEQTGTFSRPSAIDIDDNGYIYVLDRLDGNIQRFAPTGFIQAIHDASTAYDNGDYERSYELWGKVLDVHENYQLAHLGMSKALFKRGEYEESMKFAELADDRPQYTKAYNEYRYEVFRKYFVPIVIAAIALIIGLYIGVGQLLKAARKANRDYMYSAKKMSIPQGLLMGVYTAFHPTDCIRNIKNNNKRINVKVGFIILAVLVLVRMLYIFIVHYPLGDVDVRYANFVFEIVKMIIIPVTWVYAAFATTSISDGESKTPEIFLVATYSMVPFILINTPLMLMSNLLALDEKFIYGAFSVILTVWVIVIYFISIKELNDYSFGKALTRMIITGLAMALIWIIIILIYVLTGRLIQFISGFILEVRLTWLS